MTKLDDKLLADAIEANHLPTVREVEAIAKLRKVERAEKRVLEYQRATDLRSGRKLRKKYSLRLFIFLTVWAGYIGLVILLQGFNFKDFKLADSVMGILLGTTTVSIVGLMVWIVRGLFPVSKD